jgi:hypothetical protein
MIDASWHTIQRSKISICLFHIVSLSPYRIKTGLSVNWLLRNKLKPVPDAAALRACFKRRQDSDTNY